MSSAITACAAQHKTIGINNSGIPNDRTRRGTYLLVLYYSLNVRHIWSLKPVTNLLQHGQNVMILIESWISTNLGTGQQSNSSLVVVNPPITRSLQVSPMVYMMILIAQYSASGGSFDLQVIIRHDDSTPDRCGGGN